jgi:eukaryotic-like serine/threonine-protein kinase
MADDRRLRDSSGAASLVYALAETEGPRSGDDDPEFALVDLFEEDDGREPGTMVDGRYELVERLGAGGMGSVWRAHDFLLDIDVALKLVRSDKLQIVGRERLIREARATAAIQDPGVVIVHGFGISEGDGYIAMELLTGRTLEQILDDEGPLAATEAVRLTLPVIDALASAHAAGVVHRDVKPGNIMVVAGPAETLQPKLLDFGIAHQRRQAAQGRLTVTGQVLGTPCYMSYEQAAGRKDVDHRADIWSICCVLYELLAGIGPFDGDNYNAVLRAVLMDPPAPLPEAASNIDEELWAIIERGLEKEAERRWGSMKELGLALRRWLVRRGARTDIAGRTIVTSDFPAPDESVEMPTEPEPRLSAPRVATLAMPMVAPTMDDPGPTPAGLAITVPPPASPRQRLGLLGAGVALLALPLAVLGAQPTPSALDARLTGFTSDTVADLAAGEALSTLDEVDSPPSSPPPDEAREEEASEAHILEPVTQASPTVAAPVRVYRAKPPPVAHPEERSPRSGPRHLAGSGLPLPTAPRFR